MHTERRPVEGGWSGADVDAARWTSHLSREAIDQLMDALARHASVPLLELGNVELRLDALQPHWEALWRSLQPPGGPGFAILAGVPVRELTEDDALRLLWMIGVAFGTPVTQSSKGDFVGHVRRADDAAYRGYRSSAALDFHADFTPLAALLSRRVARSGGESAVVSSRTIHDAALDASPELLDVCYRPFHLGRLREEADGERPWSVQPIFAVDGDGRFGAFHNRTLVTNAQEYEDVPRLTTDQVAALDLVDELAGRREHQFHHMLQEGEILFLNNAEVLHARTGFDDHDEWDERRHLFRIWWDAPQLAERMPAAVRYHYRFGRTGLRPEDVAPTGRPGPS